MGRQNNKEIGQKILDKYLNNKAPFTYKDLKKEIVSNKGYTKLGHSMGLNIYLNTLVEEGKLEYNPSTRQYIPLSKNKKSKK